MEFMPNEIIGEKIVLRALTNPTFELATQFWNLRRENTEFFSEFESVTLNPPEKVFGWFTNIANWRGGQVYYFIYVDNKMVGVVNIFNYNKKHRQCEIGRSLAKSESGKGYMREALQLLERAMWDGGVVKIISHTDMKNERAISGLQKAGYQLEGVLKKDYYLESRGEFRDWVRYAKINLDNAAKVESE